MGVVGLPFKNGSMAQRRLVIGLGLGFGESVLADSTGRVTRGTITGGGGSGGSASMKEYFF